MVEETVRPTTASSPGAEVRGILVAGLDKTKIQIKTGKSKTKVLDYNRLVTYLLLVVWEELLRFLTTNRTPFGCPASVSTLGAGLCSLSFFSPAASSSA